MNGCCLSAEGLKNTIDQQLVHRKSTKHILTPRFQKLHDCPNGNMLECSIGAGEESMEILMHAPFRLLPYIVKGRIIIRWGAAI